MTYLKRLESYRVGFDAFMQSLCVGRERVNEFACVSLASFGFFGRFRRFDADLNSGKVLMLR